MRSRLRTQDYRIAHLGAKKGAGKAARRKHWPGGIFVELSRTGTTARGDTEKAKRSQLTMRERELISQLVADPSANYRRIAERLHITEHTVRNHLTSIYGKLGVINRLELFVYAHRHGLREQ